MSRLPRFKDVNKQILSWCLIASVAVSGGLACSQFLIGKVLANSTVITTKSQTNKTLKQNVSNAHTLKADVNKLLADKTLAQLHADEGDNNFRVILDALPVTGDAAGFAASLQNVILKPAGVSITKLTAKDETQAIPVKATSPQTVRFNVEMTGEYAAIKAALSNIEKSIRPVNVTSLTMAQNGLKWTARIAGVTYYLPEKTMQLDVKAEERP
jgi:hypothetical protein